MKNPLLEIEKCGQSLWLDYISRPLIDRGELSALIRDDHIKGVTSNPSIFEKAISKTTDYRVAIEKLSRNGVKIAKDAYENLAIKDIKDACDILLPVFKKNGADGFASLEVSPHLADDAQKTIEEGQRLWHEVARPNLMIKVPGTPEGMKAIRTLVSLGINVNVTLLFSVDAYESAALAHLNGLRDRVELGKSIDSVHGVASFFISRIDSKLDKLLLNRAGPALELLGKVAIANAKVSYLKFEQIYKGELAQSLVKQGAHLQRLLWASTSTKNKNYNDVLYLESLIGEHTVNTLPLETLIAFRDHGRASSSLTTDIDDAPRLLASLSTLGIDFEQCCQELLEEGIKLFTDAFDQLLGAIDQQLKLRGGQSA